MLYSNGSLRVQFWRGLQLEWDTLILLVMVGDTTLNIFSRPIQELIDTTPMIPGGGVGRLQALLGDSHHLASDLLSYRGCIPNTISRVVLFGFVTFCEIVISEV